MTKQIKRALVVSGGGALGAWGAGVSKGLYEFHNKDYDLYVGTSTGSLMTPLIASYKFDTLKEAYTNVNNKSIYKISPFTKKGKIKILNAVWRIITSKTSLGDSSNLKKLIDKFITIDTYNKIKEKKKVVASCVANLSHDGDAEYYTTENESLSDYKIWMEASASAPFALNLINKNGNQFTDGGIIDSIPVEWAINQGATEIDVIVHKVKKDVPTQKNKIKNLFGLAKRVILVLFNNVTRDDIKISNVVDNLKHDVTINYYYMPYRFQENSLVFNKDTMRRMFDVGYLSMNRKDKYAESISTVKLTAKHNNKIQKGYFK